MFYNDEVKLEDIKLAQDILSFHAKTEKQKVMGIRECSVTQEGTMNIEKAQWVIDIEELLINKYGETKGQSIANRIMTSLIIRDDVIH